MAITKWNDPFRSLGTVHRELDDIFTNVLDQSAGLTDNLPAMDVFTVNDSELVAEVHLPDFMPDEVEIRIQDDVLEIRGEKSEAVQDEERGRSYILRQSSTRFFRRIVMPTNADIDNIDATFENGILRISIPFMNQPEAKKVSINSSTNSTRKTQSKRISKAKSGSDHTKE